MISWSKDAWLLAKSNFSVEVSFVQFAILIFWFVLNGGYSIPHRNWKIIANIEKQNKFGQKTNFANHPWLLISLFNCIKWQILARHWL